MRRPLLPLITLFTLNMILFSSRFHDLVGVGLSHFLFHVLYLSLLITPVATSRAYHPFAPSACSQHLLSLLDGENGLVHKGTTGYSADLCLTLWQNDIQASTHTRV